MKRIFRIEKLVFSMLLIASAFQFWGVSSLQAQDFPNKPINLIVPSAAGGQSDTMSRTFVPLAPEVFGQPLVVQIKPGAGGAIGTEIIAQSKPDGHTIGMGCTNWTSILPAMEGRSRGPDELVAVSLLTVQSFIYFVQSDSPYKTIKDLIDYAKANPDKLIFGNSGTLGSVDLEWRTLEMKTGIKTRNVPHTGGGTVLLALLGGHIHVGILPAAQSFPHYRAGKLRPLAVQGSKRLAALPNVPTMSEAGYDLGLYPTWFGIVAPKGTPRPIVEKLAAGFKKMTENKQAIESYAKLGCEFNYAGPDEFAEFWRKDYQNYKKMAAMFTK